MKIVRIIGGLGNQMFQYAFSFAINKKTNVKLDISGYSQYSLHNGLELENIFGINLESIVATDKDIRAYQVGSTIVKLKKKFGSLVFSNPSIFMKRTHYIQTNYSKYYPDLHSIEAVYLDGYWQSEEYFNEISNEIQNIFKWTNISDQNNIVMKKMNSENSVSVHIRRFDKPKNLSQLFYRLKANLATRVPSKKYYLKSMKYFIDNTENPKFYIFTDNIPWVEKNIPIDSQHIIVDWNRGEKSHWDMFLMTKCKHNIISMSSFSWWGAWLNSNSDKVVIAPKKWAVRFIKDIDVIPKSWMRI